MSAHWQVKTCMVKLVVTDISMKLVNKHLSVFSLSASISHYRTPVSGLLLCQYRFKREGEWEYNLDWQTSPAAHGRLSVSWSCYQWLQASALHHQMALEGETAAGQPREEIKTQNIFESCRLLMTYESCHEAGAIITLCSLYDRCGAVKKQDNNKVRCAPGKRVLVWMYFTHWIQ